MRKTVKKASTGSILADVIYDRVIPDLVRVLAEDKRESPYEMSNTAAFSFQESDVASVVWFVREGKDRQAYELVDRFIRDGFSIRDIYLVLFTECARCLGEMWIRDECSFGDVTLGLAFLHSMIHHYRDDLAMELPKVEGEPTALIAAMPGDTHIFGAAVLEVFLSAAGWQCDIILDGHEASIIRKITDTPFDIACFSVSRREDVNRCKRMIRTARNRSGNPQLKILVGGKVFADITNATEAVGADGFANNALQALEVAAEMGKQAT